MTQLRQATSPAEGGFALIEVLISALVVLLASIATFGLIQSMTRASGEQRQRTQAYALAQEDQARMRSMRLTALNHFAETRNVPLGGTTFTVRSSGKFINNKTSTVSCSDDAASADYAQVTTEISWTGMSSSEPIRLRSIVSPSNNSIDAEHGTLTVAITNEQGEPQAGVDLTVGVFSDDTNEEGCAMFPDLLQGSHVLTSDGEDADLVSPNSRYEEKTNAGVGANAAKTTKLIYDSPGTIPVKFKYRVGSSSAFRTAYADSVVAKHSVMKEARVVGTAGGTRFSMIPARPLFPFTSPYSLYAGSCSGNEPGTGAAMVSAVAPADGEAAPIEVQVPALDLTVKEGSKLIKGAKVVITDSNGCRNSQGGLVKRFFTTNSFGKLTTAGDPEEKEQPGLPWGSYNVCVSSKASGSTRRRESSVSVKSLTGYTSLTLDLSSNPQTGECL